MKFSCLICCGILLLSFLSSGAQEPTKPDNNKFSLENCHTEAINRAKKLAVGRNIILKVLYPKGSELNVFATGKAFQKQTGVKVEYVESTIDDINTEVQMTALLRDAHFDIALPATFGIPDLAESGAIARLDDLAARYEPDNYTDGILYPIANFYKGKFYGYLTDGDPYLAFYNGQLLNNPEEKKLYKKKFGKKLKIPETWEELDQIAEFFYRPEKQIYGGSLYRTHNYIVWEFWMRFHSKGYFPLTDNMEPQINNKAGVAALEELIAVSEFLDPEVNNNEFFENIYSFSQGGKFCNFGWGGPYKYFIGENSKIKDDIITAVPPGGIFNGNVVRIPYFNWGWNYTISAFSKEKEIAYLYTLFATSPKGSLIALKEGIGGGGYFDPYRKSHLTDPEIMTVYGKQFLDAQEFCMTKGIPDFYLKGRDDYFNALKEGVMDAYLGRSSPKEALDIISKKWNIITHSIGFKSQQEQWLFLKSNYPEPLKTLLK